MNRKAARNFDPLVGFVRREIGASIIVVMNILAAGARRHEQECCQERQLARQSHRHLFLSLYLSNPIDFSYSALAVQKASSAF